jgi:hypothetical protein
MHPEDIKRLREPVITSDQTNDNDNNIRALVELIDNRIKRLSLYPTDTTVRKLHKVLDYITTLK